ADGDARAELVARSNLHLEPDDVRRDELVPGPVRGLPRGGAVLHGADLLERRRVRAESAQARPDPRVPLPAGRAPNLGHCPRARRALEAGSRYRVAGPVLA